MSALRLEVFQTDQSGPQSAVVTDIGALEEARLASFEQGYSAGWEDSVAAQTEDQTRIRADLARNIQALSFTYHEARTHVLKSLEPLLATVLDQLLPELVRPALGQIVLEQLAALARDMANAPVTLVLNPVAHGAVSALLDDRISLPLQILDEPTLGEGQVYLRLGDTETRIDTNRAIADIRRAIRDFFALIKDDLPHG